MTLKPNYGTRLKKEGYDNPRTEHFFYGLSISGFDALGQPGRYALTVDATHAGEPHCLSLDFGPGQFTRSDALPPSPQPACAPTAAQLLPNYGFPG